VARPLTYDFRVPRPSIWEGRGFSRSCVLVFSAMFACKSTGVPNRFGCGIGCSLKKEECLLAYLQATPNRGTFDFLTPWLLTEMLQVRVPPREPFFLFSFPTLRSPCQQLTLGAIACNFVFHWRGSKGGWRNFDAQFRILTLPFPARVLFQSTTTP
jgi:hypothetical protein